MKDYLEIKFWQVAKWLIKRGYGADCETKDTNDFPPNLLPQHLNGNYGKLGSRCASCLAKEVVEWIDDHISLLKV